MPFRFDLCQKVLWVFAVLAGTISGTFWANTAPVGVDVAGLVLPSTLSMVLILMALPGTCESDYLLLLLPLINPRACFILITNSALLHTTISSPFHH